MSDGKIFVADHCMLHCRKDPSRRSIEPLRSLSARIKGRAGASLSRRSARGFTVSRQPRPAKRCCPRRCPNLQAHQAQRHRPPRRLRAPPGATSPPAVAPPYAHHRRLTCCCCARGGGPSQNRCTSVCLSPGRNLRRGTVAIWRELGAPESHATAMRRRPVASWQQAKSNVEACIEAV